MENLYKSLKHESSIEKKWLNGKNGHHREKNQIEKDASPNSP